MSDDEFRGWLRRELERRGWTQAELGRRAGLPRQTINTILSGRSGPRPDTCYKLAQALGLSPEEVQRAAGLLPPIESEVGGLLAEIEEMVRRLPPERRQDILEYARWRYGQHVRETQAEAGHD